LNASGAALSGNARLSILIPVSIIRQPQSVGLRGSTNDANYGFTTNNTTFSVAAAEQRPTRYQWRYHSVPITGQTNTSLTISNVDLSKEGFFDVVITDAVNSVISNPARLSVLIAPIVLQPPLPQTVVSNGAFSASVVIKGNPPPFSYVWKEISATKGSNTTSEATNYFTYGPVTNLVSRPWRLSIYNDANPAPTGILATVQFNVTALPDSDGDGIPDAWETNYFGSITGGDPNADSDGDGMSNRAEYLAGTDPTDKASYLRVDLTTLPGTARVQVGAVSNRTYSVQYTDSLGSGPWLRLADIVARPTNHTELLLDPGATSQRFYRVVLPRQP